MRGAPVSQHSAAILKERGEAPEGKSAEQLSAEHVAWADLILTMTMNHKRVIVHLHPDAMEKTFTLKEYAYAGDEHTEQLSAERSELLAELTTKKLLGQPITDEEQVRLQEIDRQLPNLDVDDPFGGPLSVYRECADELAVEIVKTIEKLSAE